jgi:hypothetical protein
MGGYVGGRCWVRMFNPNYQFVIYLSYFRAFVAPIIFLIQYFFPRTTLIAEAALMSGSLGLTGRRGAWRNVLGTCTQMPPGPASHATSTARKSGMCVWVLIVTRQ